MLCPFLMLTYHVLEVTLTPHRFTHAHHFFSSLERLHPHLLTGARTRTCFFSHLLKGLRLILAKKRKALCHINMSRSEGPDSGEDTVPFQITKFSF